MMIKLDETDRKIIRILQDNGRITNSELAKSVGLTTTPTLERVRRLEREGIISGYSARIDAESVGKGLTVFCSVTLTLHQLQMVEEFCAHVEALPEVISCYHITGDADFLLKVVVRDTKEYELVMREKLTRLPGVQKLHTNIVLSTKKENANIPVSESYENPET